MREFFAEALVLDCKIQGESDRRVFLYAKNFGKIVGKVKSARKIKSKLSPNLQQLNFVSAKIIERGGFQIIDALKEGNLAISQKNIKAAELINDLTETGETDLDLWEIIVSGKLEIKDILESLGFGVRYASCFNCENKKVKFFSSKDLCFFCDNCINYERYKDKIYPL